MVPYKTVVLNIGGQFISATHSFVCPMHGIYVFSVSFLTYKDRIDRLHLRKKSIDIVDIWAYDDDINETYGSGSISVVLECLENDAVRVVTGESGNMVSYLSGKI